MTVEEIVEKILAERYETRDADVAAVLRQMIGEVVHRALELRDLPSIPSFPGPLEIVIRGPQGAGKSLVAAFLRDSLERAGCALGREIHVDDNGVGPVVVHVSERAR